MRKKIGLCILALIICMFPMNTWAEEGDTSAPYAVHYDSGTINFKGYQYNFRLELYTIYAQCTGNSSGTGQMTVRVSAVTYGNQTAWGSDTGSRSVQATVYPPEYSGGDVEPEKVFRRSTANCGVKECLTGLTLQVIDG